MPDKLYFEDIEVGQKFTGDTVVVDRDRMLEFASDFDSQGMHMEAEAARAMGLKDIIAPGSYTFALAVKSNQSIVNRYHLLPSGRGIELSFVRPVFAGDTLTGKAEVVATRVRDKGGRGLASFKVEYVNQDGDCVAEVTWPWLFKTRPTEQRPAS
jgi:acyl dehydratase